MQEKFKGKHVWKKMRRKIRRGWERHQITMHFGLREAGKEAGMEALGTAEQFQGKFSKAVEDFLSQCHLSRHLREPPLPHLPGPVLS